MMSPLEITRIDCARLIARVADDLRYHVTLKNDIAGGEEDIIEVLEIRMCYKELEELLKVMNDLI